MLTWKWRWALLLCLLSGLAGTARADSPHTVDASGLPDTEESKAERNSINRYLSVPGPQSYMRLHHRISWRFPNWHRFAERIDNTGDAFTLFLLKGKALDGLQPQQLKLREQLIERIEKQRGTNPDQIRVEEVTILVKNVLYLDPAYCNPTQFRMVKWLQLQFVPRPVERSGDAQATAGASR